jgi:hypothetical protein
MVGGYGAGGNPRPGGGVVKLVGVVVVGEVIGLHVIGCGVLRVRLGGVDKVSLHHIILACSSPIPFEVARERSGVRVG